ncbi:hypothetical protein LCGC14_1810720, partial [marine sediment metagenome]
DKDVVKASVPGTPRETHKSFVCKADGVYVRDRRQCGKVELNGGPQSADIMVSPA